MIKTNYKLSILIFLLFSWISFWLSINSKPNEIKNFLNTDLISIMNTFRISVPLLLSILLIPFVVFFFYKKKIYFQASSTIKIIFFFFIYFALQGLGLYFNNLLDFNKVDWYMKFTIKVDYKDLNDPNNSFLSIVRNNNISI
jgi:hypothetical protein